jgi:DNA-binding transcriptional ArsR family regulator
MSFTIDVGGNYITVITEHFGPIVLLTIAGSLALSTRVLNAPLDPVFHALADPTRRWIIEQLLDFGATVSQLAEPHPMSLTGFIRHVQVLEQCGLVQTCKIGQSRRCSIVAEPLRAAEYWMRRALWKGYGDRLGSLPEDWRS